MQKNETFGQLKVNKNLIMYNINGENTKHSIEYKAIVSKRS